MTILASKLVSSSPSTRRNTAPGSTHNPVFSFPEAPCLVNNLGSSSVPINTLIVFMSGNCDRTSQLMVTTCLVQSVSEDGVLKKIAEVSSWIISAGAEPVCLVDAAGVSLGGGPQAERRRDEARLHDRSNFIFMALNICCGYDARNEACPLSCSVYNI